MRVVVTGAGGFIGSHLCEHLLGAGHEVIAIEGFVGSYPRATKERNLASVRRHPRFQVVELDLRWDALDPCLEGADVVVNLAALAGLTRSWVDVEAYVGCNVLAVERLAAASRRAGVRRFIQASTSSVYGTDAVGGEDQPTRPVSPYGFTKLAAEQRVAAHVGAHDLPGIVLRYFSVYGPRQRPDMAYHVFIEAIRAGCPITVHGAGQQSRSVTYVEDCVRGTVAAIDAAELGETYNIGGGEAIRLNDAIRLIGEYLGRTPDVRHGPPRRGDQRLTLADTSKAEESFGYRPAVSPCDGLRAQVDWQVQRPAAGDRTRPRSWWIVRRSDVISPLGRTIR